MARRLERIVASTQLTKYLYRRRYERRFLRASGRDRLFRGVYGDFTSARAAAPTSKPEGYDNEQTARLLLEDRHRINDSDFPILFWLSRLLREGSRVFDLGGNVGISFYGYRPYLPLPRDSKWIVCDVPAVVREGEAIQATAPAPELSFTSSFEAVAGADILLAAGSLQFLDEPFHYLKDPLPRHILINKTPVYEQPSAVTIQATGSSFCPYHLFNRREFIDAFVSCGFELVQAWDNPSIGCRIPLHPAHSIGSYSGFYFRNKNVDGGFAASPAGRPA
jgi:putative methyltransferase (TIGR04325 family)